MAKKQIKSHDSFFKNLLSKREQAIEFLAKTTPAEIVKNLHLDTLQLDTTDYVDSELQEYFADIVYNCDYTFNNNETKKVKITFLFEHKSYKENIPHLQLNRYLLNIWDMQVNQANIDKIKFKDFRLQPIIPIIFYHGTTKWNKQPFENYFSGMDNFLLNFLPKFDYHLIDMVDYPNARITQLFQERQLQIGLLLMKNIFHETSLLDLVKDIFANTINFSDKTQERQFYESITSYIYHSANINIQKFIELMETLRTQHSQTFISTAMQLERKGELKGIKKVAYKLILRNFNNKFIMETTGLTENEVEYLRTLKEYQIEIETV